MQPYREPRFLPTVWQGSPLLGGIYSYHDSNYQPEIKGGFIMSNYQLEDHNILYTGEGKRKLYTGYGIGGNSPTVPPQR